MRSDLEPLLAALREGYERQTRTQVQAVATARSLSLDELYNALSVEVARRFMEGAIPFADADAIVNRIFAMMIEDFAEHGDGFVLAEPAFGIYEAFDAGEWDRRDGSDPVERYTRPALREILSHPDRAGR